MENLDSAVVHFKNILCNIQSKSKKPLHLNREVIARRDDLMNEFGLIIKQSCRSVFKLKKYLDPYDFCGYRQRVARQSCIVLFFNVLFLLAVLVTHGSCRYTIMGTSTAFMIFRQLTGLIKSLLKPSTCC